MATTPSPLETTIQRDVVWVRTHVALFFVGLALVAGLIFGGVYGVESLEERHDAKVATQMQAIAGASAATQQGLLSELQQINSANSVRDAQQDALIKSLIAQMAVQHAQTAQQVKTDATLNATDAASRLTTQTKAAPGQAVASGDTVVLDLPLTRTVVADLDQFAQAKADVTNLSGQLDAQKVLTTDAQTEAAKAQTVIVADATELSATIKADEAACKVRVDAQAKKDLKRGFWASVASFVGGVVVRAIL